MDIIVFMFLFLTVITYTVPSNLKGLLDKTTNFCSFSGLTVGIVMENIGHSSRAGPLQMYSTTSVFSTVMGILIRLNTSTDKELWSPALVNVSISASKFITSSSSSNQSIASFFTASTEASSQRKFSQSPLKLKLVVNQY